MAAASFSSILPIIPSVSAHCCIKTDDSTTRTQGIATTVLFPAATAIRKPKPPALRLPVLNPNPCSLHRSSLPSLATSRIFPLPS